jgi:hypothetical protein
MVAEMEMEMVVAVAMAIVLEDDSKRCEQAFHSSSVSLCPSFLEPFRNDPMPFLVTSKREHVAYFSILARCSTSQACTHVLQM